MASGSGRKRWTDKRETKEPSLYDEFLKEEAAQKRKGDAPARNGSTTDAVRTPSSTIRALTPEDAGEVADEDMEEIDSPQIVPVRETSSFDRFLAHTTTTIVGGPAALGSPAEQATPTKPRKLVKDYPSRSHPSSSHRNGSKSTTAPARTTSKAHGRRVEGSAEEQSSSKASRTRSKTYEGKRRERSPPDVPKDRAGSMNINAAPSSGAEYLASVPAETSPPSAPSVKSVGSGGPHPLEQPGRSSVSADSFNADASTADESAHSNQSKMSARRILHLMKTLNGRYSGTMLLRRGATSTWTQMRCYIEEESGDLIYEPKSADEPHRTLVSGLQGCTVKPNVDGDTPMLQLTLPNSKAELHLKLFTQVDFDSWYAALLYWQSLGPSRSSMLNDERPTSPPSTSSTPVPPEPPPRTSSARKHRSRKDSAKSERRKPTFNPKEAPVIKIGRMVYWDASGSAMNGNSRSAMGRPQTQKARNEGIRRWRSISGQLRENGELKLSADADQSLITVVQLSQLSRCAIQRLDPSVMDNELCIAIYPQYTSTPSDSEPGFVRPIFLGLENRVLYEVWFVLLRAFTIPQLYGPRIPQDYGLDSGERESGKDLDNVLATKTTDMFRMERSLVIRVVEAKIYPPTTTEPSTDQAFSGGHARSTHATQYRPDQYGYYAEILLDNETRGKTIVKFDGPHPLWGETFEFLDLPPVLAGASVVIKRRPPYAHAQEQLELRLAHETYGSSSEHLGGPAGFTSGIICGKVEIYIQELGGRKEMEKWWPIMNSQGHRAGDVLIKARAEEGVILMARDYEPLGEVLHRVGNSITLKIAQIAPPELKRISDCFLNIFQVSGKISDWLMALVEEEIDGIHKETPITQLRFDKRVGSDVSIDEPSFARANADRELVVRDMNKHATLEANLLFRGNTLLTKSLDTHMRRVGKEYLEESLGAKLREINAKDPECEVDPSRAQSTQDLDRNWRRLLLFTQDVWKSIVAAKSRCPVELRIIFRHIRACAEDRYGDFLRSVSYSSVSGFLFLRFFCPAVLNPKLFGLMKEDVKPRARRAFTLIAKSLQTLSNMASFGAKEVWMEPMNAFLTQHRPTFKALIDDICYVPVPASNTTSSNARGGASPTHPLDLVSTETNLSYTTPTTIMARLPPTSREGFPSLPFLIDQSRAYAELVQIWLEATTATPGSVETTSSSKSHAEISAAIKAAGGDLLTFHEICTALHQRTRECLNRAERAERPNSASSFKWDELIDQLKSDENAPDENGIDIQTQASVDALAETISNDPTPASRSAQLRGANTREWDVVGDAESQNVTPRLSKTERPKSSGVLSGIHEGLRRAKLQSQGSDSASASNVSSAPSSDTEHTTDTTALPNYNREMRHRERREAAKQQIKQHVEAARVRDTEKDKRKVRTPIVSALRKKNQREGNKSNASSMEGGYTNYG